VSARAERRLAVSEERVVDVIEALK